MRPALSIPTVAAAVLGLALLALGVVYLTVECQALPGFMGPTHGDTSPRTGLGLLSLVFGLAALIVAFALSRRRPPGAPRHP